MAASINPHYHGLVDMGRYVGLKKTIFVESHILNADYHNGGGCLSAALYECGASLGIGWAVLPILS